MEIRYLEPYIYTLSLERNKMAFISGPRQIGKTTLSKMMMTKFDQFSYKNWDETTFRKLWTKSPNLIETFFNLNEKNKSRLLILDEIHKSKSWKQKLKGIYDHLGTSLSIIVTGSARLNVYNKGGDCKRNINLSITHIFWGLATWPPYYYPHLGLIAFHT